MRASWDETWLEVASVVGRRSWCARAQVGAALVDETNRIIATGYNGPPRGLLTAYPTCEGECPRATTKSPVPNDYRDCLALHAEANALMFADRRLLEGGTAYVSESICIHCAKLLANCGVARVVHRISSKDVENRDTNATSKLFFACGIEVTGVWSEG